MNIESLRQFCLSLPHVTEDVKWAQDLCFCIASKMFCVTGLVPGHEGASFKVRDKEFEEMTAHFVRQSYKLVKSKLPASLRKSL